MDLLRRQELDQFTDLYPPTEELIARLALGPEETNWASIQSLLLGLYSRFSTQEDKPLKRAIGYLYALNRFVQSERRFPSRDEQGILLSHTTSSKDVGIDTMAKVLQDQSNGQEAKRLRQKQQKSKDVMQQTMREDPVSGPSPNFRDWIKRPIRRGKKHDF